MLRNKVFFIAKRRIQTRRLMLFRLQHRISLHLALLVPVMLLILITAGLIISLSFHNGQQAITDMTSKLRDEMSSRVDEHLQHYLKMPYLVNQSIFNALMLRSLDIQQGKVIGKHFCQQLRLYPELNSITFVNPEGGLLSAQKQADGSVHMLMSESFRQGQSVYKQDKQQKCRRLQNLPAMDMRETNWYRSALEKPELHWSEVYLVPYRSEPAIALTQAWYDEKQQLQGVLMTEVLLSHLGRYLHSLDVEHSGKTFIMQSDGFLIASSERSQPFSTDNQGRLQQRKALDSCDPLIRATAASLLNHFGAFHHIQQPQQLHIHTEHGNEFVQVSPFKSEHGLDWLIIVALPETDFMHNVKLGTRITLYLSAAALFLALLLSWRLSRAIIVPIQILNQAANKLMQGQWTDEFPQTHIDEVQQLANAFAHMSAQLRNIFTTLEHKVEERTRELQSSLLALEHSETALQESEAKYHALVEQIPVTVYEASLEDRGHLFYVSPQIKKLSGDSAQQWIADHNTWHQALHPDDKEQGFG